LHIQVLDAARAADLEDLFLEYRDFEEGLRSQ
jgi:hypothetical protein